LYSMVMHPNSHDLVVGTGGRNVWVLDDLSPLRSVITDPGILNYDIFLFEPDTAYLHNYHEDSSELPKVDYLWSETGKPYGASFYYWVGNSDSKSSVSIEILDFEDEIVRTIIEYPEKGFNHFVWDLKEDLPESLRSIDSSVGNASSLEIEVLPGNYKVRIKKGFSNSEQSLEVVGDPRIEVPLIERITKYQALKRYLTIEGKLAQISRWVNRVHQRIDQNLEFLAVETDVVGGEELRAEALSLKDRLKTLSDFSRAYRYRKQVSSMSSSYDAPTEGQRLELLRMEETTQSLFEKLEEFNYLKLEVHEERLKTAGIEPFFFPELIPQH